MMWISLNISRQTLIGPPRPKADFGYLFVPRNGRNELVHHARGTTLSAIKAVRP
ncbi:hypothetical protein [Devosia sp. 2618]|uniref:hypothetical protein n=1 Tax=Devosia sp. 2618 TaxID=3156454 RepID=UPI003390A201